MILKKWNTLYATFPTHLIHIREITSTIVEQTLAIILRLKHFDMYLTITHINVHRSQPTYHYKQSEESRSETAEMGACVTRV